LSNTPPAICDYEGSTYRVDFWEGKGRSYEDAVERVALRALLPPTGKRYVDFGGGFGRLVNEADRYDQVVLVDYSRTMLQDAQTRLKDQAARMTYVAADLYHLPFVPGTFDVAISCRVIHHIADVPAALAQIRGSMATGGTFILEFANKLNMKAIARYALRLQKWSPYQRDPVEFVKLNFDFHPGYMRDALRNAGFEPRRRRAVSWLRLGAFKRILPLRLMTAIDKALQPLGGMVPISPSIFTENRVPGPAQNVVPAESMFKCPTCGSTPLQWENTEHTVLRCTANGHRWGVHDGIFDFKTPLS